VYNDINLLNNKLHTDFTINIITSILILSNVADASFDQIDDAKLTIERAIISRVYTLAMYPNGDADFYRDQ
jgi:hypothetical protein